MSRHFSNGPPPNWACKLSLHPALQCSSSLPQWHGAIHPSGMDVLVTLVADDQGLALAADHSLDPGRLVPSARTVQILQVPYVVDIEPILRAAQFARPLQESVHYLVPEGRSAGKLVVEDRMRASLQWYASPACRQRTFTFALDPRFQSLVVPFMGPYHGREALVDVSNADPQFAGERPGQRPFHGPLQTRQPRAAVVCQL